MKRLMILILVLFGFQLDAAAPNLGKNKRGNAHLAQSTDLLRECVASEDESDGEAAPAIKQVRRAVEDSESVAATAPAPVPERVGIRMGLAARNLCTAVLNSDVRGVTAILAQNPRLVFVGGGHPLLHFALDRDNQEIISEIFRAACLSQTSNEEFIAWLEAKSLLGVTVLHVAVQKGQDTRVREILGYFKQKMTQDAAGKLKLRSFLAARLEGITVLHLAAYRADFETASAILSGIDDAAMLDEYLSIPIVDGDKTAEDIARERHPLNLELINLLTPQSRRVARSAARVARVIPPVPLAEEDKPAKEDKPVEEEKPGKCVVS
jgi:hypothetical protein